MRHAFFAKVENQTCRMQGDDYTLQGWILIRRDKDDIELGWPRQLPFEGGRK
jgi:hypothetical protein